MKLLVFSGNYPTAKQPFLGIFVYKLMQEIVKQGNEVVVIAPRKITFKNLFYNRPYKNEDKTKVYNPLFLSLSNKQIMFFNTAKIGSFFKRLAVNKVLNNIYKTYDPDIFYAHFMWSAFMAVDALEKYKKPILIVAGETPFGSDFSLYKKSHIKALLNKENYYISVSTPLKNELLKYGADENNILVSHNSTDKNLFFKRDKIEMRKKYNIPLNSKIIVTVGRLSDPNKGVNELLKAIKDLSNVKGVFLGDKIPDEYSYLSVFNDFVPNYQVPELLSCADLFVFLTANEGSSNAIVEAMSCGLPMVVSAIPEVIEQCDTSFAKFVDRKNISEIRYSISSIIYDDILLETMSNNALDYSKKYSLDNRAKTIIDFIKSKIKY
ncbi:MAG: glycosyltransferase family 4 protein [Bacteroidales bacterium]